MKYDEVWRHIMKYITKYLVKYDEIGWSVMKIDENWWNMWMCAEIDGNGHISGPASPHEHLTESRFIFKVWLLVVVPSGKLT